MAYLLSVTCEWDGAPSSVPPDAAEAARLSAERLARSFETRQPISCYIPARSSDDFPEGTWTYDAPSSRGRWHARFQETRS